MIRLRLRKELVFRPRPDRRFDRHYQEELAKAIDDPDYRPKKLDEELRLHFRVDVAAANGIQLDARHLVRAYEATRQHLLAPEITDRTEAVAAAFLQPEAKSLWEKWTISGAGERYLASHEAAKAVLATTAALGETHIKSGRDKLKTTPLLLETFTALAASTSRAQHLPPGLLPVREYSAITKLLKPLAEEAPLLLQEMNVSIVRELARLFPSLPIGHWLSIDAQAVPAWAVQASAKRNGVLDPEVEAFLRRRAPHAGFRSYGYDRDGVGDPADPSRRITDGKKWRGYLQLILVDHATGIALVGMIVDASKLYEPNGLPLLLRRLYAMWPDIPLEGVVGDKLFDDKEACLMCERDFGIAGVFIRQPSHATQGGRLLSETEHETIGAIDGWGIAYCRRHNLPMRLETVELPNRVKLGLEPGEPAKVNQLRLRVLCTASDDPCGKPSLRMRLSPSALTRLPHHHRAGRPDLFALRQALFAARNSSVESAHGSLQLGYRQGTKDGSRARVYDLGTLETLLWIGYGTRALLLLLAHRTHHNEALAWIEKTTTGRRSRLAA